MRWIFFSLIAANFAILAWWQTSQPQRTAEPKPYTTPAGVGGVVLLSEAAKQPAQPPQSEANSTEAAAPPAAETVPATDSAASPPPAAEAPGAHGQCVLVGPYENNEQAQQALQKLLAKEIKAHVFQMDLAVSSGYQIYLDGFENRAQAKKRLDELQAAGVDSFIVPKGEYLNTIALGSYEQESAAKHQLEKFAAAGITAKLRESKRSVVELWLAMPPEMGDRLPEALRPVLGVSKAEKKEERQILCSTIASDKNIL